MDSELQQLYKTDRNPIQETRYQELLRQQGGNSGSSGGDATEQYIQNAIFKLDDVYFSKIKEFDKNNPFVYDDVLKQEITKAGTRLDPYYKQTLNDYLKGIDLQKSRSLEDKSKTLTNLNADINSYTTNNKEALIEALDKSRQGFSDVGNYFSGAQERNTAKQGLESNQNLTDYLRGKNQAIDTAETTNQRTLQDTQLKQDQFQRDVGSYGVNGEFTRGAQSEATVRSQAINEIPARQAERQFALNQYAGPPPGADQNQFYLSSYSGLQ